MCGLFGVVSENPVEDLSWLSVAGEKISHRGPDDSGIWKGQDNRVGLGHARLAILELSQLGHQPMQDQSGDLVIVFNGEIYNHSEIRQELVSRGVVFRSRSDTEVILESYRVWGTECLSKFVGMFSFALYDARSKQLFAARDRAGEKPFFYKHSNGVLHFASELKALLVCPKVDAKISRDALDCYLYMGYVPGEECILSGFNKLPPAHALLFNQNDGSVSVWRYWQLPNQNNSDSAQDEESLISRVESSLERSIRGQLEADVDVGVLLSGGLDSSLITALASQSKKDLKTFTVRFNGHPEFDESRHARIVSKEFGTTHHELDADEVDPSILPTIARQFDEPIIDSSQLPMYLVSKLVSQHCKVVLGGDGGDELFGGYIHYPRLLWMAENLGKFPLGVRRVISRMMFLALPIGFRGRNWLAGLGTNFEDDLPLLANYFDRSFRQKMLGSDVYGSYADERVAARVPKIRNLLQRATEMDFNNYLAEDILVKVDRASMLNSIEVRAPFLDYRLIELAMGSIPPSMKSNTKERKILLRRLAKKLLPRNFDVERKQGFSIPLASWLAGGEWREYFEDVLFDESCVFNQDSVRDLFKGQDAGRNNSERLYGLVMLELWRREYSITF